MVEGEWKRYSGDPQRVLRFALRERFLLRHLGKSGQIVLELGPGPGRFTPLLRKKGRGRVLAVDLSLQGLRAARRQARRRPALSHIDWIQGAGEHLPLAPRSIDTAVVLGNIVNFAAGEGSVLLVELRRVLRPRGRLIVDFASAAGAVKEFLHVAAERRFLPIVLRRPQYFLVDQILDSGFQPFAPERMTRWDFQFYTMAEAEKALDRAGFRVVDAMSIAPIAAHSASIASIAHREKRTWAALLKIEERVGRRPGAFEVGNGFVICADRK
jgi:ubiquinone/menaquinone biosynthesis C-methylase UbiE